MALRPNDGPHKPPVTLPPSTRPNPATCDHRYPNGRLAVAQVDLDRICVLCLLETCSHCRRVLDGTHDISPCPNKHRNPNRPEWMNR